MIENTFFVFLITITFILSFNIILWANYDREQNLNTLLSTLSLICICKNLSSDPSQLDNNHVNVLRVFCVDAYATTLLQFSLKKQKTEVRFITLPQFKFVGTTMHQDQLKGKGDNTSFSLAWPNEEILLLFLFSGIPTHLMLNNLKKCLPSSLSFFRYYTKSDHCRAI